MIDQEGNLKEWIGCFSGLQPEDLLKELQRERPPSVDVDDTLEGSQSGESVANAERQRIRVAKEGPRPQSDGLTNVCGVPSGLFPVLPVRMANSKDVGNRSPSSHINLREHHPPDTSLYPAYSNVASVCTYTPLLCDVVMTGIGYGRLIFFYPFVYFVRDASSLCVTASWVTMPVIFLRQPLLLNSRI